MIKAVSFLIVLCVFISCGMGKKENDGNHKKSVTQRDDLRDSLFNIEFISKYLYSQTPESIMRNEKLGNQFKIQKYYEESEGVEWVSFKLFFNDVLSIIAETSWEDSTKFYRISFINPSFKTSKHIGSKSSFREIKGQIDINRINEGEDGYLSFYDAKNPNLVYIFDVIDRKEYYYGIKNVNVVSPSLKIDKIIVFHN